MADIVIEGVSFEVVEQGRGDPLVFIHGSASDHRTWRVQQPGFARRYRAIRYSRRYHWPNEPIPEGADYALDEHVEDLRALLGSLDATPANLVGHSYGALVALHLAIAEPRMVRSLVLAEPPAITLFVSDPPRPHELLRLAIRRPRTAAAIAVLGVVGLAPAVDAARRGEMDAAARRFGRAVLGNAAYRRLSRERWAQVRRNLFREEFVGSGLPPLNAEDLRHMEVPTLLLTGEASPPVFRLLARALQEHLPCAERAAIPDASHILHEDNPSAFHTAVEGFLERQAQAASPWRPAAADRPDSAAADRSSRTGSEFRGAAQPR